MPTFEEDRSGENCNRRSWGQDHEHRSAPRRPGGGNPKLREPYLRLDNRRLFRRDLEEMDLEELVNIAARLETDNESIDRDLPTLSGDAEIKAKDKKRFNEQWIKTIREDLLEDEEDEVDEVDDYIDAEELEKTADASPTPVADRFEEYLSTPEGRQEIVRKKLEIQACLYKRIPPEEALELLVAAVNKHLSPEVAAVIFNEVT